MSAAGTPAVDFVWQNAPTIRLKAAREAAAVYSHLANADILEDKGYLAKLQSKIQPADRVAAGVLEGVELGGRAALQAWCDERPIAIAPAPAMYLPKQPSSLPSGAKFSTGRGALVGHGSSKMRGRTARQGYG